MRGVESRRGGKDKGASVDETTLYGKDGSEGAC